MSNRSYKKQSEKGASRYYGYNDISLRLYFEIVKTKNLRLLVKNGKADTKQLTVAWENILKQHEKASNSLWYYNHLGDLTFLRDNIAEYIIVRATLGYLHYKPSAAKIAELQELGYVLDTSSDAAYAASLTRCMNSARNLLTQIHMKGNEMEIAKKAVKEPTFDTVMAQLSLALGFILPEDITLARYNEYTTLIQERNKPKQQLTDNDNG